MIGFVLKLQDMISAPLSKISGKSAMASQALNQLQQSGAALQAVVGASGQSIDGMSARIDRLRAKRNLLPASAEAEIRAINREINALTASIGRLESINGNKLKAAISQGVDALPFGLGAAVKNPYLLAGTAALGTGRTAMKGVGLAMDADKQRMSFEVMAGKQAGGKLDADLTKFARQSIFGNEVKGLAQTQLAFGAGAHDVMPTLKMLGDISMGDKEKLQSLNLAYSQIRATGRLMGQDLLQLVNAGFNPLQIISEKTGRSMGDLKKAMEEGRISFDLVKKAFEAATGPGGRFFGMLDTVAGTAFGKWEALKGGFEGLLTNIGMKLLPLVNVALDGLASGLDWAGSVLGAFWRGLESSAAWVQRNTDVLLPLSAALATIGGAWLVYEGYLRVSYLWMMRHVIADMYLTKGKLLLAAATGVLNGVLAVTRWLFITTPIGWIVAGVALLVAGIVWASQKFGGFNNVMRGTWEAIKELGKLIWELVVDRLRSLLKGIAGVGHSLYLLFTGEFKQAFEKGKEAVLDLTGINTARKALEGARRVGDAWNRGVHDGLRRNNIYEAIQQGFTKQDLVTSLERLGIKHGDAYLQGFMANMRKIARVMDRLYEGILGKNYFSQLLERMEGRASVSKQYETIRQKLRTGAYGNPSKQQPEDANWQLAEATKTKTDLATSGGSRPIIINVNRPFVEGGVNIYSQTVNEGTEQLRQMMTELARRVFVDMVTQ